MRAMRFGLIGFAVVVGLAMPSVVRAQYGETSCTTNIMGVRNYGLTFDPKSPSRPFTAKLRLTVDQRLDDGNRIHGVRESRVARDSSGRVRTEQPAGCYMDDDGKMKQRLSIIINNQADRSFLTWQEESPEMEKIARLQHFPEPRPARKLTPEELAAIQKRAAMQRSQRNEFKNEDLGTKNFFGMEVHGRRTTRTIPPGEEGNELALKIVDEEWRSTELGLMMQATHSDPRSGTSTWEVVELDREEPLAALFSPPEGYKLVEIKPQVEVPVTPTTAQ